MTGLHGCARRILTNITLPRLWVRAPGGGCVTLTRRLITAVHLCVLAAGRQARGCVRWWRLPETCVDGSQRPLRPSQQERAVRGRRLLRSAPRGAGLCRIAAARRGARLATWATVRQRRREWLWSKRASSRMYTRLAAGLDACIEHRIPLLRGCGAALIATSLSTLVLGAPLTVKLAAPAAWLLRRRLSQRPTLCGDGAACEQAPGPALRSKSFELWACWRRRCSRAQQPLLRCISATAFCMHAAHPD